MVCSSSAHVGPGLVDRAKAAHKAVAADDPAAGTLWAKNGHVAPRTFGLFPSVTMVLAHRPVDPTLKIAFLGGDRTELAQLNVSHGLPDLVGAVHHEGTVLHDRFVDRFSG